MYKLSGGASMVRSLSFVHLFVILAIGYIGGAFLFREMSSAAVEKMLTIFDARVIDGHEAGIIRPIAMTVLFFVVVYAFSSLRKLRFTTLFFGAVKCVLFGLSSAYLLSEGMKIIDYTIWWFPFQFLTCLLFLIYCAVLSPPFFTRTNGVKKRNDKAVPRILLMTAIVTILEISVFYFLPK
jgi:hypothetical protein